MAQWLINPTDMLGMIRATNIILSALLTGTALLSSPAAMAVNSATVGMTGGSTIASAPGAATIPTITTKKTKVRARAKGKAPVRFSVPVPGRIKLQYQKGGKWKTWLTTNTAADGTGSVVLPISATSRYWRVKAVELSTSQGSRRTRPRPTPTPTPTPPLASPSPSPTQTAASPSASASASAPTQPGVPTMPPEATLTIPDGALNVLSYGAKGDGVTDDSAAIARAQAALTPGGTLVLPKGMVFAHSTVLKFTVANTRITGGGTLLATNPLNSAVWIDANTVTLDHLAINTVTSTNRYAEYERQGIRVLNRTGTTISDVSVTGPAAAGIYISRSSQFTLARVRVTNSLADAIHITGGSHDATLTDIAVTGSGDDGIAVVSLANGDPAVANITVTNASVTNQRWGRAFSVVGGNAITWRNIYSEKSNAAAIYIAAESAWQTQAVTNVLVDGATIVSANTNSTVDHGAILLYNSLSGATNTGINLNNITIKDTRTTASRQVSILDGTQQKILMTNFTITGGPTTTFGSNLPTTSYATKWWTYNGTALADRVGW